MCPRFERDPIPLSYTDAHQDYRESDAAMGAERLHLGRIFQRDRQNTIPRSRSEKASARKVEPHTPRVVKQIQDAETDVAKRIAGGTAGHDAKDKTELAEYFNEKLGREEFTA